MLCRQARQPLRNDVKVMKFIVKAHSCGTWGQFALIVDGTTQVDLIWEPFFTQNVFGLAAVKFVGVFVSVFVIEPFLVLVLVLRLDYDLIGPLEGRCLQSPGGLLTVIHLSTM